MSTTAITRQRIVLGLVLLIANAIAAAQGGDPWAGSGGGIGPEGSVIGWTFQFSPGEILEWPDPPEQCRGLGPGVSVTGAPPGANIVGSTASWQTGPGDKGIHHASAQARYYLYCCDAWDLSGTQCVGNDWIIDPWLTFNHGAAATVIGAVDIEAIEPTQAIQVWQPIDDITYPALDMVAGKATVVRVYLTPVTAPTRVRVHAQISFDGVVTVFDPREVTLSPLCDWDARRRGVTVDPGDNCKPLDYYIENPPAGIGVFDVTVEDTTLRTVPWFNEPFYVFLDREVIGIDFRESSALAIGVVNVCPTRTAGGRWNCLPTPVADLNRAASLIRNAYPTHDVQIWSPGDQIRLEIVDDLVVDSDLTDWDQADCYDAAGNKALNGEYVFNGVEWELVVHYFDPAASIISCEKDIWWDATALLIDQLYTLVDLTIEPLLDIRKYYYGLVAHNPLFCDADGCTMGMAHGIPARGALGITAGGGYSWRDARETAAHEIGHLLGRRHTDTDVPAYACDFAEDGATDWPYGDNWLRSGHPFPDSEPLKTEYGFFVPGKYTVKPVNAVFDLMSYCSPMWISPWTWKALRWELEPPPPPPPTSAPLAAEAVQGDFWLVSGFGSEAGIYLNPLVVFNTIGPAAPNDGTGALLVVAVLDAADEPLFWRYFTPATATRRVSGGEGPKAGLNMFSELLPVTPGGIRIVVADAWTEEIYAEIPLGGVAPTVTVTAPSGGETIDGDFTLAWTAIDPDSNDLIFWVQYSVDQGATWSTLQQTGSATTLDVDFHLLPGTDGEGLLRVLASDGANTGVSTSLPFSVTKKPPVAQILNPEPDTEWALGGPVFLEGFGYDPEDGDLPDASLVWTSDVDGALGTGADLAVSTLSEGTHTVTLAVADSDGNPANADVTFDVIVVNASETEDEDEDNDTVLDYQDNCLGVANTAQRDTDEDGFGNFCDPDFNGNEIVDPADFSLLKARFGQPGFPDQDLNGNGIVDPFDFSKLKSMFGQKPGPSALAD